MNKEALLDLIQSGETSRVQFKQKMTSIDSFSAEMAAMANALGGMIIVGVEDKTGKLTGLTNEELYEINSRIANIATNNVIPLIYVTTEIVTIDNKKVLIIHIEEGINKPYKDRNGVIWIKQGADKRKLTDNAELLRLFQKSGTLFIDEMEVHGTSINDINKDNFKEFYKKEFDEELDQNNGRCEQILRNMKIMKNERLTLGGLLFFGKQPQKFKPAFCIKAVSFVGNEIESTTYRDSRDIIGTIPALFDKGMGFFLSNLHWIQKEQDFNSLGIPEVSKIALEELLQNALVHRDYSKNAPVRIFIFDNRVEIISPGSLPNSLNVENIKAGNVVIRNNLLASFCSKTMKYRGLGSGVKRALKEEPGLKLINDIDGEQFIVIFPRTAQGVSSFVSPCVPNISR